METRNFIMPQFKVPQQTAAFFVILFCSLNINAMDKSNDPTAGPVYESYLPSDVVRMIAQLMECAEPGSSLNLYRTCRSFYFALNRAETYWEKLKPRSSKAGMWIYDDQRSSDIQKRLGLYRFQKFPQKVGDYQFRMIDILLSHLDRIADDNVKDNRYKVEAMLFLTSRMLQRAGFISDFEKSYDHSRDRSSGSGGDFAKRFFKIFALIAIWDHVASHIRDHITTVLNASFQEEAFYDSHTYEYIEGNIFKHIGSNVRIAIGAEIDTQFNKDALLQVYKYLGHKWGNRIYDHIWVHINDKITSIGQDFLDVPIIYVFCAYTWAYLLFLEDEIIGDKIIEEINNLNVNEQHLRAWNDYPYAYLCYHQQLEDEQLDKDGAINLAKKMNLETLATEPYSHLVATICELFLLQTVEDDENTEPKSN